MVVTGIIMASGFSSRMGRNKLLIKIQNKTILEYVIEAAKASKLDNICLVYRSDEIRLIGEKHNIKTIINKEPHLGQSQSVILGVQENDSDAYMFLVGDQPFITTDLIDILIENYKKDPEKIVVPYYQDKICMPILFPSRFKEELLKVKGDKGGRGIIRNNPSFIKRVDVVDEKVISDIDTIEDLNRFSIQIQWRGKDYGK